MRKHLLVYATFVAVLGINLYFRAFPAFFPQLKKSAADTVLGNKFEEISGSVRRDFSGIPVSAQKRLVEAQYSQYKKADAKALAQQVNEEYLLQKDRFQDKTGQTYLMELDCWHWARYVENVLKYGRPWDVRRDGRPYDTLMLFPDGSEIGWNDFLFYSSAGLYRLAQVFVHDLPLQQFLFYLPLFHVAVFLGFLFFFCYRSYGLLCAFISCLFIGCAPIFIPRSVAGWFDMDVLTMLLPLIAIVCYLYSFESSGKRRVSWLIFSAAWMGLFAFTWSFWFVFAMIIGAYEVFTLSNLYAERLQYKVDTSREMRIHFRSFVFFLLCTGAAVFLFCGSAPYRFLPGFMAQGVRLNDAAVSVWPTVLSTVGELKRPDIMTIGRSTGDVVVFCLALCSMLAFLLLNHRFRGLKRESIVLFTVWFIAMFVVSFKGVRFVMFLLVPLGIMLGWGMEELFGLVERKRNWVGFGACALLLIYSCFSFVSIGNKTARGAFPLMTDQWYSILTTIRKDTPPDAVISSWWDFGDWFKTAGGRAVIFDGQSQEGPRAYWMAQALLSANETKALNILRMLNNGGNRAFEILDRHFHDPVRALLTVKELVSGPRSSVRERLAGMVPAADVARVESIIFDPPRHKGYFVVDSSMLMKMPAISFLGNWDAVKVYVSRNLARRSEQDIIRYLGSLGIKGPDAEKIVMEAAMVQRETAEWLTTTDYSYGFSPSVKVEEGIVFFDNGSTYNPATHAFNYYNASRRTFSTPLSVFAVDGGEMEEIVCPGGEGARSSAVVIKEGDGYELMLASPEIVRSIFFRLYYLQGHGCAHFRPFAREKDTAAVYEILW